MERTPSSTGADNLTTMPLSKVVNFARRLPAPDTVKAITDLSLITIAAAWAWFASYGQVVKPGNPLPFLAVAVTTRLVIYFGLKLHRTSWLHVSRHEVLWLAISAVLGLIGIGSILAVLPEPFSLEKLYRPSLILITEPALYMLLLCAARITVRAVESNSRKKGAPKRVLLIGAGAAGRAVAFQIQESVSDYRVLGFLDDDPRKIGRSIRGIPVLGPLSSLKEALDGADVEEVVVAISSLPSERLRVLMAECEPEGVPVRILPPLSEMMGGRPDFKALREVRMEDLLPRPEVKLDREALSRYISGRTVLITGGGGSIGGELCRQVLAAGATKLLILGRGENSVFEISQELGDVPGPCELVPIIADVRDRQALHAVFDTYRPQVVFHAAAHKHVPLMEKFPAEAVKNNVVGTLNVVQLSVEHQVERFVMVSTDKAVDPSSVMGATKRLGEMIVKGYAVQSGMNMVSVRFGNVLGSRGSVVPTMTRQIRRGLPVTVTDPEMVRYFMTIPEAVQLILQAGAVGGCGEIFILDMGHPVRIMDLAQDLIRLCGLVPHRDIPIRVIGFRPGEKVQENLLTSAEAAGAEKQGPFYVVTSDSVQLSWLLGHIDQLSQAAQSGDTATVLGIMHDIVPEYANGAGDKAAAEPAASARPAHGGVDGSGGPDGSGGGAPKVNGQVPHTGPLLPVANTNANGHANGHAKGNGNGHGTIKTPAVQAK